MMRIYWLLAVMMVVGCAEREYKNKVYVKNYPTLQDCVDDAARQPHGGLCVIEKGSTFTNEEIATIIPRDNAAILDERNGSVWMVVKPPTKPASPKKEP